MLTVKVMRRRSASPAESDVGLFSTKIIEAEEVDVHILRPGELTEVAARCGDRTFAFYIIPRDAKRPDGFADEVEFHYAAFIENAAGATTEIVKF